MSPIDLTQSFMKFITITFAVLSAAFLFSNCTSQPIHDQNQANPYLAGYDKTQEARLVGYWDGDGVDGPAKIKINLARQKAYFYKGSQLVGETPISSGSATHRTPRGTFKVTQKDEDHRSSLYGQIKDNATGQIVVSDAKTGRNRPKAGQTFIHAPMFHFLRFNGAIGMHKGYLPGYPASHGCVRLPGHMAKIFYENASHGTPVIVE